MIKKFFKKNEKILSFLLLLVIIATIFNLSQNESDFFIKNGRHAVGTTIGYEGNSNIKYSFKVDSITYVDSYHEGLHDVNIGEKYIVVYDPYKPSYSIIFFHKRVESDNFIKYNITKRDFNMWYRFGFNNFLDTKYIIYMVIGFIVIGIIFFFVRKIYLFICKKIS